jgi:hypothetical protein
MKFAGRLSPPSFSRFWAKLRIYLTIILIQPGKISQTGPAGKAITKYLVFLPNQVALVIASLPVPDADVLRWLLESFS